MSSSHDFDRAAIALKRSMRTSSSIAVASVRALRR
jgi:hypothetical protein